MKKPYWHLERCRIEGSRKVPVELIVNGEVAQRTEIEADGQVKELSWNIDLKQSSWIALRILPSVHTNPIFAIVEANRFAPIAKARSGAAKPSMYAGNANAVRFARANASRGSCLSKSPRHLRSAARRKQVVRQRFRFS